MKHVLSALAGISLLTFCYSMSLAKTWYIKADGTGDCATIQTGVDSAKTGDIVLLANGIYKGVRNRRIDFFGKEITVKSESGNPDSCVIDCEEHMVCGFEFESGEGSESILEGVTITNGRSLLGNGGGIYCANSSPTILNCRFTYNSGGIECSDSSPTITDCDFLNNHGAGGGGMACFKSNATITNCTFSGNTTDLYGGGGIYCSDSSPVITNCIFENNSTLYPGLSGGGIVFYSSTPVLTGCKFYHNSATSNGGAIFCSDTSPVIQDCTFFSNMNTGVEGSGIYAISNCVLEVSRCTFSENLGDVLSLNLSSSLTLNNTIIAFWGDFGNGVSCGPTSTATLSCCNLFIDDPWFSYVGCLAGQNGINGNFSANPEFCGILGSENLYLQSDSPCAPGNHPNGDNCGLIGSLPVGCSSTPVEKKSWGAIKAIYGR